MVCKKILAVAFSILFITSVVNCSKASEEIKSLDDNDSKPMDLKKTKEYKEALKRYQPEIDRLIQEAKETKDDLVKGGNYSNLASLLILKLNDYENALEYAQEASKYHSFCGTCEEGRIYKVGACYAHLGMFQKAREWNAKHNKGEKSSLRQIIKECEEHLPELQKLKEKQKREFQNPDIQWKIIECYGNLFEDRNQLISALRMRAHFPEHENVKNGEVQLLIARIYLSLAEYDNAKNEFQRLVDLFPGHKSASSGEAKEKIKYCENRIKNGK